MARDPAQRRCMLTTNVTIIQLQTELLQQQLKRRADLTEADRHWLATALVTILQATRQITLVIIEDGGLDPTRWVRGMPTRRLMKVELPPQRN
jgi:hypothetical protein